MFTNLKCFITSNLHQISDYINSKKYPKINIESIDKTIEKIINDKCSIARYGDGEFELIFGKNLKFQYFDNELSQKLEKILKCNDKNMLVCLPDVFNGISEIDSEGRGFWRNFLKSNEKKCYELIDSNKVYYNSFITRFYSAYKDYEKSEKLFSDIKKIWDNREIIIVEGSKSRLGVGNDLFNNCMDIKRIICPEVDAFKCYESILNEVKKHNKNKLILIALGPTATVLAYELYKEGYQAIDIGHIDIQYEWYLIKAKTRVKINNKYTNEVQNGDIVENINDIKYDSEIIFNIE